MAENEGSVVLAAKFGIIGYKTLKEYVLWLETEEGTEFITKKMQPELLTKWVVIGLAWSSRQKLS